MPSAAIASSLPPEVLTQIFDQLVTVERLLLPMLVCRQWRDVVLDHPIYWQCIYLRTVTAPCIDAFLMRLSKSNSRWIFVGVSASSPCVEIRTRVLPAIAAHMHHVQRLSLEADRGDADAVMQLLNSPAPVLQELNISFRWNYGDNGPTHYLLPADRLPELSSTILYGGAPALRSLTLENARLPSHGDPACFRGIRTLRVEYAGALNPVAIPDLLRRFSAVIHLEIRHYAVLCDQNVPIPQCWNDLAFISFPSPDAVDVRGLAASCAAHVQVYARACTLLPVLVAHLEGPLRLTVDYQPYWCRILALFTSNASGRTRSIILPDRLAPAWAFQYKQLSLPSVTERVAALVISLAAWPAVAGSLASLPALTTLTVVLEVDLDQWLVWAGATHAVHTPALHVLTLHCEARCSAPGPNVERFIYHCLPHARLPLTLRLTPLVALDGSLDDLERVVRFDSA